MPRKAYSPRKATLLGAAALVAAIAGVPGPVPFGITEASAATYTRKRVNGRWITGRFTDRAVPQRYASLPARMAEPVAPPLPPARPEARERTLADRVIATASLAPVAVEPRLETMRPALEARARTLAGEVLVLPLPEPPPPLAEPLLRR